MINRYAGCACVCALFVGSPARAAPPSVEAFARMPNVFNVWSAPGTNRSMAISPDGAYLSWIAPSKEKQMAVVLDLKHGGGAKAVLTSEGNDLDLRWCSWANEQRLVCGLGGVMIHAGILVPASRLIAVNADGSKMKVLMQDSGASFSLGQDDVVDWTPDDPANIDVAAYYSDRVAFTANFGSRTDTSPSIFRINVLNGGTDRVEPPFHPIYDFVSDGHGHVRLGYGIDRTEMQYFARLDGEDKWRRLGRFEVFQQGRDQLIPVAIGDSPNTAFALGDKDGLTALWEVDLADKTEPKVVVSHPRVDIAGPMFLPNGRVIGAYYNAEKPGVVYGDQRIGAAVKEVNKQLPGRFNYVANTTADLAILVIRSTSDVDEGSYYLYDVASKALRPIARAYPELDPQQLGHMQPMSYPAADGTMIPGYLTLPPGAKADKLPLIVMPHGGPIARDNWEFFFLKEFLVSRGYAVLQMNFRGSDGYGNDWFRAAHQDWGGLTYSDVTDGAKWAVSQGIADPKRVCVVGWSFGGYIALLGAVRNPDLFTCSVSIAGVSDLAELTREQGYEASRVRRLQIGTDPAKLAASSPRLLAERLAIPLLMVHGDHDIQVEVHQSKDMASALKKAGKPYEFILLEGATHQLDRKSDRMTMLAAVEKFLAKNLGAGVVAP